MERRKIVMGLVGLRLFCQPLSFPKDQDGPSPGAVGMRSMGSSFLGVVFRSIFVMAKLSPKDSV